MTKRRPLIEGISENEDQLSSAEKSFVYGAETKRPPKTGNEVLPQMAGRVPITTRARPEIGSALKRASLQRQLDGVEPNSMQDIMEEALESWLNTHGYLA